MQDNATLDLISSSVTVDSLNGGGTITSDNTINTLTVGNLNQNNSTTYTNPGSGLFSGSITDYDGMNSSTNSNGVVALTKDGSKTLTLSGSNTYSGITTINSGTLLVTTPSALSPNSTITVGALQGASNVFLTLGGSNSLYAMDKFIGATGTLSLNSTNYTYTTNTTNGTVTITNT